jgi:hypothetical protein
MKWNFNNATKTAVSEEPSGYRITWLGNENKNFFFNAFFDGDSPPKHLEASYDREVCKKACLLHAAKHLSLPVDPATTQR